MRKIIFLLLAVQLIAVNTFAADFDKEIIVAALERTDGKVDMVDEKTIYWTPDYRAQMNLDWIKDNLRKQGIDAGDLVEKLYDLSTKESTISIKSAPDKGYVVDIDSKYRKYLRGEDGFTKLFKDYPNAGCFVSVSNPVYDVLSRLALIQKHVLCHPGGTGVIEVFKNEQGKFRKIGWVGVLSLD